MKKRNLIIDTDPGIDDAAAITILLSEPSLDVKLIASVSGNVGIEHTTNNALKLLTFLNKKIPVAKGAAAPLMRENRFATNAHGKSGMGGFEFPEFGTELLLKENAVMNEYYTLLNSEEKVTILTLGPLTNIALLIATFPEIKEKIDEIILLLWIIHSCVGNFIRRIFRKYRRCCFGEVFRNDDHRSGALVCAVERPDETACVLTVIRCHPPVCGTGDQRISLSERRKSDGLLL